MECTLVACTSAGVNPCRCQLIFLRQGPSARSSALSNLPLYISMLSASSLRRCHPFNSCCTVYLDGFSSRKPDQNPGDKRAITRHFIRTRALGSTTINKLWPQIGFPPVPHSDHGYLTAIVIGTRRVRPPADCMPCATDGVALHQMCGSGLWMPHARLVRQKSYKQPAADVRVCNSLYLVRYAKLRSPTGGGSSFVAIYNECAQANEEMKWRRA